MKSFVRFHQISVAFLDNLNFTKMSKVDTLKHAVDYIQNLQVLLNEKSHRNSTTSNTDFMLQQPPHTGKMNFLIGFFTKKILL